MHMIYSLTYKHLTYIGQSTNVRYRMNCHKTRSKSHTTKLYNAMRKYGFEQFKLKVLATCETKKDADVVEQALIHKYGNLNTYHNTK